MAMRRIKHVAELQRAHMISWYIAQGHINREIFEILEVTRFKPSRQRRKGNTVQVQTLGCINNKVLPSGGR